MIGTIRIERLGQRGDGVGRLDGALVHVAGALPGENVQVEIEGERGRLLDVETPSPDRIAPFCPLFGTCGGCAVQHLAEVPYRAWKRGLVVDTLARAGLDLTVGDLVDAHGVGRRRVVLHARRLDGNIRAGFMAARSHDLVPVPACPVLVPELAGAVRAAERVAAMIGLAKPLDIQATATKGGLDLDVRGGGKPHPNLLPRLAKLADELDLARLSIHHDVIVERRAPLVAMGPAQVAVPAGGFLQATAAGEAAIAERVVAACDGAKRVADLFAGCGPFALRLAQKAEVHAVETEASALAALDRAWRNTPGLKRITSETRDLFRRPLLPIELDRFDIVVLDPPRAGAEAQVAQLALSKVATVVMVSCDVHSFARDARTLIEAGFTAGEVTPLDQFRHSGHVELVSTFRRPKERKRR